MKNIIKKILTEYFEQKWNDDNTYDYQYGHCHYFAKNLIDKIKKRFPNKSVKYYMLCANEKDMETGEIEQEYLIHVYIKIDDLFLDSNGFIKYDKIQQRMDLWFNRQKELIPDEYEINMWEEEVYKIPNYFFNDKTCKKVKILKDVDKFLNHPITKRILRDK